MKKEAMIASISRRRNVIARTNENGMRGTRKGGVMISDTQADVVAIARRHIPLLRVHLLMILRLRKTAIIIVTGDPGNMERVGTSLAVAVVVVVVVVTDKTKYLMMVVSASTEDIGQEKSLAVVTKNISFQLDVMRTRRSCQCHIGCPNDDHSKDDFLFLH